MRNITAMFTQATFDSVFVSQSRVNRGRKLQEISKSTYGDTYNTLL